MSSIISEKNSTQRTSDKARNETTSKQTRTSTNQEEKKRKQNAFPTITNVYCTSHLNRISQATNCQVNKSHHQVG